VVCVLEVTSLSIFGAEPGRNCSLVVERGCFSLDERSVGLPKKMFFVEGRTESEARWCGELFFL
jgi:hypothetical protein